MPNQSEWVYWKMKIGQMQRKLRQNDTFDSIVKPATFIFKFFWTQHVTAELLLFSNTTLQIGMELIFPTWILKEFCEHRINPITQFCLTGSLLQLPFQSEFCLKDNKNSDHIRYEFGPHLLFFSRKAEMLQALLVVPWHFWSEKKVVSRILIRKWSVVSYIAYSIYSFNPNSYWDWISRIPIR